MSVVAALFVRADSIYKTIPGVDCYDAECDARTWPGGCPLVAHPPCRTWGRLKALARAVPPHEHALGPWAIAQARRWGGVVEHPQGSTLFHECGCGAPQGPADKWGGRLLKVDQFNWGHKARKRTLLYVVGARRIPKMPKRDGKPTHVIDKCRRALKLKRSSYADTRPWCSKKEREATPPEFAAWLVTLARNCRRGNKSYGIRADDKEGKP